MKGIVLAGGRGTRLWPITTAVSKQLLPIYNKPLIHYPISTLMLAGIRDIGIICSPKDLSSYVELLGDGNQFGINLQYLCQESPDGIAQAFLIGEKFIENSPVSLILGDNIFYGKGLGRQLRSLTNIEGAHIFAQQVSNPKEFGVIELGDNGEILSIEEKPDNPKSNYAIPGLYFYDNTVISFTKELKPSPRGELEITDLNQLYLKANRIEVTKMQRGTAWFDTGTFESLHDASTFIRITEKNQNVKIGCIEEIAILNNWVTLKELSIHNRYQMKTELLEYLETLLK